MLSALVLGSLLTIPPASAAITAAPVKVAVTKVKATPAKYSGACPTTVGFSAVIVGKGTVRYRWVRGDGSKGKIKTIRVKGKATVRDRQTFERSVRGWQAVQVAGKKGLSKKAYFTVECASTYDTTSPLRQGSVGEPVIAAAHVTASTSGTTCPATVTFTSAIQVSGTPARIGYRWIDSAGGEGPIEYLNFAAGAARSRTVTSTLGVSATSSGWRAIDIVGDGHDSARATYSVTCAPTPTPTPTTTTSPPVDAFEVAITGLTPGDYNNVCDEQVKYKATGVITRKAGTAATIKYEWVLDGVGKGEQTATFVGGRATVTHEWEMGRSESVSKSDQHTVELVLAGGKGKATRTYSFICRDLPGAKVKIIDLEAGAYNGSCTPPPQLTARAGLQAMQAGTVAYHWVVDGKASGPKTQVFDAPGSRRVDYVFTATKPGKIELVVDNYDRPRASYDYRVTCSTNEPDPEPVAEIESLAVGEGVKGYCPFVVGTTAKVKLDRKGTLQYRWVIDGVPGAAKTHDFDAAGSAEIKGAFAYTKSGTAKVGLEVLNLNKPSKELTTKAFTCQTTKAHMATAEPPVFEGNCQLPGRYITLRANIESAVAQKVVWRWVDEHGTPVHAETDSADLPAGGGVGVVDRISLGSFEGKVRLLILEPTEGVTSEAVQITRKCRNATASQLTARKISTQTWCTGKNIDIELTAKITSKAAGTIKWRWLRKTNLTGANWVPMAWETTTFAQGGDQTIRDVYSTTASESGRWELEFATPDNYLTTTSTTFHTCLDR